MREEWSLAASSNIGFLQENAISEHNFAMLDLGCRPAWTASSTVNPCLDGFEMASQFDLCSSTVTESGHCGKHLHCVFLTPMFLTRPMMSDVELGRGASEVVEWQHQKGGVEEGLMSGITTKGQDGIGMMVVPVQSAGCFATSAQLGLLERSAVTPAGLAAWKAGTSPAAQHGGGT